MKKGNQALLKGIGIGVGIYLIAPVIIVGAFAYVGFKMVNKMSEENRAFRDAGF